MMCTAGARRAVVPGTVAALALLAISPNANASPPGDPILGFAPSNTDIVFYSDIASLQATLAAGGTPYDQGARERLEQLRGSLPLDVLKKLNVRAICTFHIHGTDHQLAVFELDQPPKQWLAAKPGKLARSLPQDGRQFVVFSRTPELVAKASWSPQSRLPSALVRAASALVGRAYWAVVALDAPTRARLIANTGVKGKVSVPELEQLQQIWFTGQIVGSNNITVELSGEYATDDEAVTLGPDLGPSLPFPTSGHPPVRNGHVVTFTLDHVSFEELNKFLSLF